MGEIAMVINPNTGKLVFEAVALGIYA